MPIQVLIVDDHAGVRRFLQAVLKKAADIEVIGEAQNGREALNLVNRLKPDVMLLDIEMPGMTGLEVARELQARKSKVGVLAISAYNDRSYIRNMLANGAAGYLVKEQVPGNLIQAIRDIANGGRNWIVGARVLYIEAGKSSY